MSKILPVAFFFVVTILFIKVSNGMDIFRNDFEKKWEELSSNVEKLNSYTKNNKIELRNIKVKDLDLDGAIFNGANFTGVEWEGTLLQKASFISAKFTNCKFINSLHWRSSFTDVVFENCVFEVAEFGNSSMINVKFKNCKISDSRLKELTGSELIIEDSVLDERTSLAWSSIPMIFRRCTLDGVGLSGMKQPNTMLLEDSYIDEVDFGRGLFSNIMFRRVNQGEGPAKFNGIFSDTITFEDVNMTRGVSLAYVTAKSVHILGGIFRGATEGSKIAELTARDAELPLFDMSESQMAHVSISNCQMYDIALWDCFIDEYSVVNSTIDTIRGKNFKADIILWDNVTLDGKIDMTNAQVKDFRPTRLTRGPNLQLITIGSNLRF